MTNEKKPFKDGYKPQSVEKGYQPTKPKEQPVKGGYIPTSSGDNPTNRPSPPPGNE